jgi:hypothetical protein
MGALGHGRQASSSRLFEWLRRTEISATWAHALSTGYATHARTRYGHNPAPGAHAHDNHERDEHPAARRVLVNAGGAT